MKKIIGVARAVQISKKIKDAGKTIVLTGGSFDILHIGHIRFLQASKREGDILFILLENDSTVKKIKGDKRPINSQKERAEVLEELKSVDYVVNLPDMNSNQDYDKLIFDIAPNILTTTVDDPQGIHNERQAKQIGAKVKYVVNNVKNRSTTRLAKIIQEEFEK